MGTEFYGNITNTSRTHFQFDKYYSTREEMDKNINEDGVFIGRYVLVKYGDDSEALSNIYYKMGEEYEFYKDPSFITPWDKEELKERYFGENKPNYFYAVTVNSEENIANVTDTFRGSDYILDSDNNRCFLNSTINGEKIENKIFQLINLKNENGNDLDNIYYRSGSEISFSYQKYYLEDIFDEIDVVKAEDKEYENVYNVDIRNNIVKVATSEDKENLYEVKIDIQENKLYQKYSNDVIYINQQLLTKKLFSLSENDIVEVNDIFTSEEGYISNYKADQEKYGRGYDCTVWQKVYINNELKYIKVAELNAAVPGFEVIEELPTSPMKAPYITYDDSNNFKYDLHIQKNWDFNPVVNLEFKEEYLNSTNRFEGDSEKNEAFLDPDDAGTLNLSINLPKVGETFSQIWDLVLGNPRRSGIEWIYPETKEELDELYQNSSEGTISSVVEAIELLYKKIGEIIIQVDKSAPDDLTAEELENLFKSEEVIYKFNGGYYYIDLKEDDNVEWTSIEDFNEIVTTANSLILNLLRKRDFAENIKNKIDALQNHQDEVLNNFEEELERLKDGSGINFYYGDNEYINIIENKSGIFDTIAHIKKVNLVPENLEEKLLNSNNNILTIQSYQLDDAGHIDRIKSTDYKFDFNDGIKVDTDEKLSLIEIDNQDDKPVAIQLSHNSMKENEASIDVETEEIKDQTKRVVTLGDNFEIPYINRDNFDNSGHWIDYYLAGKEGEESKTSFNKNIVQLESLGKTPLTDLVDNEKYLNKETPLNEILHYHERDIRELKNQISSDTDTIEEQNVCWYRGAIDTNGNMTAMLNSKNEEYQNSKQEGAPDIEEIDNILVKGDELNVTDCFTVVENDFSPLGFHIIPNDNFNLDAIRQKRKIAYFSNFLKVDSVQNEEEQVTILYHKSQNIDYQNTTNCRAFIYFYNRNYKYESFDEIKLTVEEPYKIDKKFSGYIALFIYYNNELFNNKEIEFNRYDKSFYSNQDIIDKFINYNSNSEGSIGFQIKNLPLEKSVKKIESYLVGTPYNGDCVIHKLPNGKTIMCDAGLSKVNGNDFNLQTLLKNAGLIGKDSEGLANLRGMYKKDGKAPWSAYDSTNLKSINPQKRIGTVDYDFIKLDGSQSKNIKITTDNFKTTKARFYSDTDESVVTKYIKYITGTALRNRLEAAKAAKLLVVDTNASKDGYQKISKEIDDLYGKASDITEDAAVNSYTTKVNDYIKNNINPLIRTFFPDVYSYDYTFKIATKDINGSAKQGGNYSKTGSFKYKEPYLTMSPSIENTYGAKVRNSILTSMAKLGIDHIDYFIATHFHYDHLNNNLMWLRNEEYISRNGLNSSFLRNKPEDKETTIILRNSKWDNNSNYAKNTFSLRQLASNYKNFEEDKEKKDYYGFDKTTSDILSDDLTIDKDKLKDMNSLDDIGNYFNKILGYDSDWQGDTHYTLYTLVNSDAIDKTDVLLNSPNVILDSQNNIRIDFFNYENYDSELKEAEKRIYYQDKSNTSKENYENDYNQRSLCYQLSYGTQSFVNLGDAYSSPEITANLNMIQECTILKTGHHGLDHLIYSVNKTTAETSEDTVRLYQTITTMTQDYEYIRKLNPKAVICSAGTDMPSSHPFAQKEGTIVRNFYEWCIERNIPAYSPYFNNNKEIGFIITKDSYKMLNASRQKNRQVPTIVVFGDSNIRRNWTVESQGQASTTGPLEFLPARVINCGVYSSYFQRDKIDNQFIGKQVTDYEKHHKADPLLYPEPDIIVLSGGIQDIIAGHAPGSGAIVNGTGSKSKWDIPTSGTMGGKVTFANVSEGLEKTMYDICANFSQARKYFLIAPRIFYKNQTHINTIDKIAGYTNKVGCYLPSGTIYGEKTLTDAGVLATYQKCQKMTQATLYNIIESLCYKYSFGMIDLYHGAGLSNYFKDYRYNEVNDIKYELNGLTFTDEVYLNFYVPLLKKELNLP